MPVIQIIKITSRLKAELFFIFNLIQCAVTKI